MQHRFLEFIPDQLEEGTLYISLEYCTAIHLCVCGCCNKVVTPISPTDWKITFDGKRVSLYPSIGNWNFECRSHYWIRHGMVEWADSWDQDQITKSRNYDIRVKERHFRLEKDKKVQIGKSKKRTLWNRFLNVFFKLF